MIATQTAIDYAKRYMNDRLGPISECADKDRWHERLGIVFDAYDELLNVYLKEQQPAKEQP